MLEKRLNNPEEEREDIKLVTLRKVANKIRTQNYRKHQVLTVSQVIYLRKKNVLIHATNGLNKSLMSAKYPK